MTSSLHARCVLFVLVAAAVIFAVFHWLDLFPAVALVAVLAAVMLFVIARRRLMTIQVEIDSVERFDGDQYRLYVGWLPSTRLIDIAGGQNCLAWQLWRAVQGTRAISTEVLKLTDEVRGRLQGVLSDEISRLAEGSEAIREALARSKSDSDVAGSQELLIAVMLTPAEGRGAISRWLYGRNRVSLLCIPKQQFELVPRPMPTTAQTQPKFELADGCEASNGRPGMLMMLKVRYPNIKDRSALYVEAVAA